GYCIRTHHRRSNIAGDGWTAGHCRLTGGGATDGVGDGGDIGVSGARRWGGGGDGGRAAIKDRAVLSPRNSGRAGGAAEGDGQVRGEPRAKRGARSNRAARLTEVGRNCARSGGWATIAG